MIIHAFSRFGISRITSVRATRSATHRRTRKTRRLSVRGLLESRKLVAIECMPDGTVTSISRHWFMWAAKQAADLYNENARNHIKYDGVYYEVRLLEEACTSQSHGADPMGLGSAMRSLSPTMSGASQRGTSTS